MDGREEVATSMEAISRTIAEREADTVVSLYRDNDDVLRYEDLYDQVDAEGMALPPDQWRDGYWDAGEFIAEATEVGIYNRVDAFATVVKRYSDGESLWTYEQLRDRVLPQGIEGEDAAQFVGDDSTFEAWIAESLIVGTVKEVAVMEYRDQDEGGLVAERLVIDD